jgi:putative phosphoribosyl transferase
MSLSRRGRPLTRRLDPPLFEDRHEAGQHLAERLSSLGSDTMVIGLARGGMPVAAAVAHRLLSPLDVLVVRKMVAPGHRELTLGALAHPGVALLDQTTIARLDLDHHDVTAALARERREIERRDRRYREGAGTPTLRGRTVVVVDDGCATGATMSVALTAVRRSSPERLIAAIPVAPPAAVDRLTRAADEVVTVSVPEHGDSVGRFYRRFEPVDDDEVVALLRLGRAQADDATRRDPRPRSG